MRSVVGAREMAASTASSNFTEVIWPAAYSCGPFFYIYDVWPRLKDGTRHDFAKSHLRHREAFHDLDTLSGEDHKVRMVLEKLCCLFL